MNFSTERERMPNAFQPTKIIKFGLIGSLGTLVNMAIFVTLSKLLASVSLHGDTILFSFPIGNYSFRLDHAIIALSFIGANLFNYSLNRTFTFSESDTPRIEGSIKFLLIGTIACLFQMALFSALVRGPLLQLPTDLLDGSTGFRNIKYWAQIISIILVLPINFFGNYLWTFRAQKSLR
ncbi:GtrA family protein [Corynebacterium sp.]|uniref:GtrA family protein n=1 Tax=Corynebacterium sp. TaxID=1720 RepID=UPI0026DCDE28|nr:GtrA family protein [Corynebacterium sp.]MDO5032779.1 GtrA family protein [Corynebacterium sp.]